jgi:hypothetical protein
MAAGVNVWHALGFSRVAPCVITSGNDSIHKVGSLHARDKALDFRTRTLADRADKFKFRDAMRGLLGPGYDVILEDVGGPNEHLHVEYDPKGQPSQLV